jgi:hypothetical protein
MCKKRLWIKQTPLIFQFISSSIDTHILHVREHVIKFIPQQFKNISNIFLLLLLFRLSLFFSRFNKIKFKVLYLWDKLMIEKYSQAAAFFPLSLYLLFSPFNSHLLIAWETYSDDVISKWINTLMPIVWARANNYLSLNSRSISKVILTCIHSHSLALSLATRPTA